jgi:minimal CRISPR polymerase domain
MISYQVGDNRRFLEMLDVDASYFYGLDGDRITNVIEDYLFRGDVDEVRRFSKLLTSTLEEIKQKVIGEGGRVEYCAGDNILFYGKFSDSWCEGLLGLFYARTGCTASIGIGATSAEFCLALKRAKTAGGRQIMHYWDQPISELLRSL